MPLELNLLFLLQKFTGILTRNNIKGNIFIANKAFFLILQNKKERERESDFKTEHNFVSR